MWMAEYRGEAQREGGLDLQKEGSNVLYRVVVCVCVFLFFGGVGVGGC